MIGDQRGIALVEQRGIAVADYYVDLGHRIAEARDAAGISQHDLGVCLGLSKSAVSNAEVGTRATLAHNVVRYAAVLAVDPLWLLTGDSPPLRPPGGRTGPLRAAQ